MNDRDNFSLIVPTLWEAKNIPELIARIAKVDFSSREFEVIIIDDDSNDGVVAIVEALKVEFTWLRIIVRKTKRDLSQSILEGFLQAKYNTLVTMDADLSHPPEKIPEMLSVLSEPDVEVVLGSRYIAGGSMDCVWPLSRKIASRGAAFAARMLLGIKIKDPLSGFIAVRKNTLATADPFDIVGWKIALEIMVKTQSKNVREIPIHFSQRKKGASKVKISTLLAYLIHLKRLAVYKISR